MRKINQFIDGKEYLSKSDRLGDIFNPAQGEKIAEVSLANKSDVDAAIESALDCKTKMGFYSASNSFKNLSLNLKNSF
jgi:malonate-semialdehyde dehydrogenase (acetylating)/methylmalonate-semialdehyde dehydrogenase